MWFSLGRARSDPGPSHVRGGSDGGGLHLPGRPWEYFLWPRGTPRVLPIRYDWAGLANYAGLACLLGLLALSNDLSLRRFGSRRWKGLQRWNYGAFAFLAAHAAVYQAMERRTAPWVVLVAAVVMVVVAVQVAGWRHHRARRSG